MLIIINDTINETCNITTQETTQKTTQEKILKLIKEISNITQTQMTTSLGLTYDGISYNIKQIILNVITKYIEETKN